MSDNQNNEPDIAQLRERADQASRLEQAGAAKDREIAFLKAGVDTGTLLGRNIMQTHGDKEITPEAIADTAKSVRAELGLPEPGEEQPKTPKPGDPGTPEAQIDQTQQTLHGNTQPPGSTPPPPPKDLIDVAADTYVDARKHGVDEIKAQEAAIGEIIRAGHNGHQEARYDAGSFQQKAQEVGHGAEFAGLPERSYAKNIHHSREDALRR